MSLSDFKYLEASILQTMKLRDYFDTYCINITAFARKIGKSKPYIYRLLNGITIPKVKDAKLIEEATDGKVTKEELLFPEEFEVSEESEV